MFRPRRYSISFSIPPRLVVMPRTSLYANDNDILMMRKVKLLVWIPILYMLPYIPNKMMRFLDWLPYWE